MNINHYLEAAMDKVKEDKAFAAHTKKINDAMALAKKVGYSKKELDFLSDLFNSEVTDWKEVIKGIKSKTPIEDIEGIDG